MILFLYGSDTFRLQEELNDLRARFIQKNGKSNLAEIDLEDTEPLKVFETLTNLPLFVATRFVIVKNFLKKSSKQDQERLLEFLSKEEDSKELVICFVEKDDIKNTKLAQYFKKLKHAKQFEELKGLELSKFTKELSKKKNYDIEPQALEMIVIRSHGNLWWIAQTLEQLCAYANNQKINVQHVQDLTTLRVPPTIFRTIDAIAERKSDQALKLIQEHLKSGDNEEYLLSMIYYQFANLIQIKELAESGKGTQAIEKMTKLHPFVVKKTMAQASRFTMPFLRAVFAKLADADIKVKNRDLDASVALDLIVMGLAK
jgi:DNA polymerase-3 subunit delta